MNTKIYKFNFLNISVIPFNMVYFYLNSNNELH